MVVVDEDVEGGEGSGGRGWPCWTPGQGVVGGTYDGLRWPCRLPVDGGGVTRSRRGRTRRLDEDNARTVAFPRRGRRRGAYHVEVDAQGRRRGPRAAALQPEGATQQQRTGRVDGGCRQQRTCLERRVGRRQHEPMASARQPEGVTQRPQRQHGARSVVGACSGTCLAVQARDRLIRPTQRGTRHDGDDDAQIGVDGEVVGEVPVDDGEEKPAMETLQAREAGGDASRRPLDGASSLVARSVKTSRSVRSRRRRVGRSSRLEGAARCGVGAGESPAVAGCRGAGRCRTMPLSE